MTEYVLIQVNPVNDNSSLAAEVIRIQGVVDVARVSGPYDLIAEVQDGDSSRAIQQLDGVLRAIPLPIMPRSAA